MNEEGFELNVVVRGTGEECENKNFDIVLNDAKKKPLKLLKPRDPFLKKPFKLLRPNDQFRKKNLTNY